MATPLANCLAPEAFSQEIWKALERAGLDSVEVVLTTSSFEMERSTRLSKEQVAFVMEKVSRAVCPGSFESLTSGSCTATIGALSTGCSHLDQMLRGGIPFGQVTEVTGESAAGKTNFILQLLLSAQQLPTPDGTGTYAICIATESEFPASRMMQMASSRGLPATAGERIFVESAFTRDDLFEVLTRRLPVLMKQRPVRLVVLDSVTAIFRVEQSVESQRARDLFLVSTLLRELAGRHNCAVVVVNQISDEVVADRIPLAMNTAIESSVGGGALISSHRSVRPALGLTWSHCVNVRLALTRTENANGEILRRLHILFAPHLPTISTVITISDQGLNGSETAP